MSEEQRHLTEGEVKERMEAMLNKLVMPEIAALKNDVASINKNLKRFIGDGNGGGDGVYGRDQAEAKREMADMAVDVKALKTEKTQRDAVAKNLKEKAVVRDRGYQLLVAVIAVTFAGVMVILGLLTWHYTHHADLLSNHNPVVAQYNSGVEPH